MKKRSMFVAVPALVLAMIVSLNARAADAEEKPVITPPATVGETPAMSEIPAMKAQGERMATLMEQLSKESNPDIRRGSMAEARCPH